MTSYFRRDIPRGQGRGFWDGSEVTYLMLVGHVIMTTWRIVQITSTLYAHSY